MHMGLWTPQIRYSSLYKPTTLKDFKLKKLPAFKAGNGSTKSWPCQGPIYYKR